MTTHDKNTNATKATLPPHVPLGFVKTLANWPISKWHKVPSYQDIMPHLTSEMAHVWGNSEHVGSLMGTMCSDVPKAWCQIIYSRFREQRWYALEIPTVVINKLREPQKMMAELSAMFEQHGIPGLIVVEQDLDKFLKPGRPKSSAFPTSYTLYLPVSSVENEKGEPKEFAAKLEQMYSALKRESGVRAKPAATYQEQLMERKQTTERSL